ncbi:class I SAM-dependent methyltransferase [Clostridium sporogenes]|nr:class I SAM-dependent methyltransferase [Clostridium sporogenes]NFS24561.1 class I SAM-dependent methyltransferase [Clostridium sporogenes]
MSHLFEKYNQDIEYKVENFEKYVKRQSISRFLARYELIKKILKIKGSIVECGVHNGAGVMAFAKLSSILEPYATKRKIIGFDTFEGFPDIADKDVNKYNNETRKPGGFALKYDVLSELKDCIKEYDENRYLNHIDKVELIKGDAIQTIPQYVEDNPHCVISLLFLDFDLYEPTKVALEYLLPRIPKGGIIVFDEINDPAWPGETIALFEKFKSLNNLQIKKFEFDPHISYIVM